MMASIYCEICGQQQKGIETPEKLIEWTHREARKPVTCLSHRRVSLYDKHRLKYNPLTGKSKI